MFAGLSKNLPPDSGKADFFLVGEVAGGDADADRYLEVLGSNLNATLDIGEIRPTLTAVAKGLAPPAAYFDLTRAWHDDLGSHRTARKVVSAFWTITIMSPARRFASPPTHRAIIKSLPERLCSSLVWEAFAGPETSERQKYLPDYGGGNPPPDKYLRDAMFGPEHPRLSGLGGLAAGAASFDPGEPGFGPFGTVGAHVFNPNLAAYVRIAALTQVRTAYPSLRYGRQYPRPIGNFGAPFALPKGGELIAWSRILDDEEVLCIVNGHGTDSRGADVVVDSTLNSPDAPGNPFGGAAPAFQVVANTEQAAAGGGFAGSHPVGSRVAVQWRDGNAYVPIRNIGASEVVVLVNRA
jgi:hypothetical protein